MDRYDVRGEEPLQTGPVHLLYLHLVFISGFLLLSITSFILCFLGGNFKFRSNTVVKERKTRSETLILPRIDLARSRFSRLLQWFEGAGLELFWSRFEEMGCFLGCFRIKDDDSRRCHMFSKFYSWKKRDLVLDRNQYTSVVSCEERGISYEKAERDILEENFDGDDSICEKLRQEAKFLKTCGAILETPIEIRKASVQQSIASDPCCMKLNWDQQLEENDELPIVDPEALISEEEKLKSCKREENIDTTKKMVRFEELNHSVAEKMNDAALEISPTENQIQSFGSESPYPTPLNLVDDMQTPGTIYPGKSENFRTGRIRAQFIYPVPDLSQKSFELNVLCEDGENTQKMPPASLKKELRPPLPRVETKNNTDFRKEPSHSDKSPDEDRPIIGAAAAHWNDEEPCRISPKQWDGNGIPNSTTKYKEDQKVSWHATPFEVRLEKALSDEKVYPPRKLEGKLVEVDEDECRE